MNFQRGLVIAATLISAATIAYGPTFIGPGDGFTIVFGGGSAVAGAVGTWIFSTFADAGLITELGITHLPVAPASQSRQQPETEEVTNESH